MFIPARATAMLLGCSILAGCNATDASQRLGGGRLGPLSGTTVREGWINRNGWTELGPLSAINPDCSFKANPRISIIEPAQNGRVSITNKTGEIAFRASSSFARCNDRPVRGLHVRYTPRRDFTGQDRYRVEVVFPDGERRDITTVVTVR